MRAKADVAEPPAGSVRWLCIRRAKVAQDLRRRQAEQPNDGADSDGSTKCNECQCTSKHERLHT